MSALDAYRSDYRHRSHIARPSYRAAIDGFGAWLALCVERDQSVDIAASALYKSYTQWARAASVKGTLTQTAFGCALTEHQIVRTRRGPGGIIMRTGCALKGNIKMPFEAVADALLEDLLIPGRLEISPQLAGRILAERNYERQRKLNPPDATLWSEMLQRGTFGANFQIWFVRLPDRLHMVDGQHRLTAVRDAGVAATFQVEILPGSTLSDVHEAYTWFDRAGRKRSAAEAMNAMGVAEAHGVRKGVAMAVRGAAVMLNFRFAVPHAATNPIAIRGDHERVAYCAPYWASAAVYQHIIARAPPAVRRRMLNPQVLAIALLTLNERPEQARPFWDGVATGEGLWHGDPRRAMLAWMDTKRIGGYGHPAAVGAALAWNAWFEHRSLTTIKVAATDQLRVAGTDLKVTLR